MPVVIGARLGPYEILSALGAGGMGEVWKARDTRLDRIVAIKILRDTHSDLQTRFVREAKAIAALAHPNMCSLFDIGHEQGTDYLVMEHLEGETLAAGLKSGSLLIAQALHYAVQMASALDAAHRAGIVHRDLKPSNVMLVKGDAKLLDFGLAKHAVGELETITAPGMILGTVQYMAPEQLEERDADARTDVFAFGAVLYEMLTGRKAFSGTTQASVIASILDHEPAAIGTLLPSTPPALDRIVQKCLAKDPDERWQTARDLTSELRWVKEASSTALAPQANSASATTLRQRAAKSRVYWATAVMAALVAVSSALFVRRAPAVVTRKARA